MFKQTLLAGAVLAVSQAASAAFVIDNFNLPGAPAAQVACDTRQTAGCFVTLPDGSSVQTAGQVSQYQAPAGNIFGNYRELFMAAPGNEGAAQYEARVEGGVLAINTPGNTTATAAQPWSSVVRWDGAQLGTFGNEFVGGLNLSNGSPYGINTYGIDRDGIGATDLTSGLQNIGFSAEILRSDGDFTFELQVFSGNDNWTSLILGATRVGNCGLDPVCFPAPYTLNINFSQFQTLSGFAVLGGQRFGNGVDFSAVTAAQLIFHGTDSVDFTIDMIQAVPEPTSLALVGLGLLGAGLARRRMKKA